MLQPLPSFYQCRRCLGNDSENLVLSYFVLICPNLEFSAGFEDYLPDKNHRVNIVKVQTKNGVGTLHIMSEDAESYFLSFYNPNESKAFWKSPLLPNLEAINGVWFLCWTQPGGFLA